MSNHGARSACFCLHVLFLLSLILGIAVASSTAQTTGVTDSNILIGSCSTLDGPARFLGTQTVIGATAYLHGINDEGGVFGRKIQLLAFDDGYDPDKATTCFKRMIDFGRIVGASICKLFASTKCPVTHFARYGSLALLTVA